MNSEQAIEYCKATRRPICENCPTGRYNKDTDCCTQVAVIGHPSLKGHLNHRNGIPNPRMRCPEGHWERLESYHAYFLKSLFDIPEVWERELLKSGVVGSTTMKWVNRLSSLQKQNGENPKYKLSELLAMLEELTTYPNGYQHYERPQENA